jgi:hypothetical protein
LNSSLLLEGCYKNTHYTLSLSHGLRLTIT